ncbi:hypothetical protein DFH07DRAFT_772321 [Mycena maculata]|uniref:Uncharacterized protein n=1 Tax=Mycena maculata TaxID=230809 RepID=A0AAD7JB39_9AGAR|nr:hypothetical protein DFH07DRAFT_772321 [Mycena maculata]
MNPFDAYWVVAIILSAVAPFPSAEALLLPQNVVLSNPNFVISIGHWPKFSNGTANGTWAWIYGDSESGQAQLINANKANPDLWQTMRMSATRRDSELHAGGAMGYNPGRESLSQFATGHHYLVDPPPVNYLGGASPQAFPLPQSNSGTPSISNLYGIAMYSKGTVRDVRLYGSHSERGPLLDTGLGVRLKSGLRDAGSL